MNNKLYCSTGVMIGRVNLWNEELIREYCPRIEADGFELMMVNAFYEKAMKVLKCVEGSGCSFPIIHAEKDIGIYLAEGDEENFKKATELFRFNCNMGREIGAKRMVFHLWSGKISDSQIEKNISALSRLCSIAADYSLELLIENVPCTTYDPISNFKRILSENPDTKFVYDMRFGGFHCQNNELLSSDWLAEGRIAHVHVSGYTGPDHDFSSLRPIMHLDEGIVDYKSLLPRLFSVYNGSVTNEAPESKEVGCGIDKINADMKFLRNFV